MMCSTGFSNALSLVFFFSYFKGIVKCFLRDPGFEITNKHQAPSFEKCTNYKENKFSWRNCKTQEFQLCEQDTSWAEKFLAICERHEKMKEI